MFDRITCTDTMHVYRQSVYRELGLFFLKTSFAVEQPPRPWYMKNMLPAYERCRPWWTIGRFFGGSVYAGAGIFS